MKTKSFYPLLTLAVILTVFSACQKGANTAPTSTSGLATTISATALSTGAIAIGTTVTSFAAKDSIYAMNCFPPRGKKDSVTFSALPATIGTYLTANYAGYTFTKAFKITDTAKTVLNYIVVIKYNSNPVAIKFTATGTFISVLEQRAGADLMGRGWHPGGPFENRGGGHPDTVAISAIPAMVTTYFKTSYAADTLLHAAIAPDGAYILISKNKTLFATTITAAGAFVNRVQVDSRPCAHTPIAQASLPAAIATYLTATYPGYVFDKAFSDNNKSAILGYDVFITANTTKYVVEFDAVGVFVKAAALR